MLEKIRKRLIVIYGKKTAQVVLDKDKSSETMLGLLEKHPASNYEYAIRTFVIFARSNGNEGYDANKYLRRAQQIIKDYLDKHPHY